MGKILRIYYNDIINDPSMSDWDIKELIDMLEKYLDEIGPDDGWDALGDREV